MSRRTRIFLTFTSLVLFLAASAALFWNSNLTTSTSATQAQDSEAAPNLSDKIEFQKFVEKKMWGNFPRGTNPPVKVNPAGEAHTGYAAAQRVPTQSPPSAEAQASAMAELQRYCMNEGRGTRQCGGTK